jgi:hypothetical protein
MFHPSRLTCLPGWTSPNRPNDLTPDNVRICRSPVQYAKCEARPDSARCEGWSALQSPRISLLKKLSGRRETEPLIYGHGPTAGVNRHATRAKAQGVLGCRPNKI